MSDTTARPFADRYTLHAELGRGSFGVVYRATDARLGNRPVALKILHPQMAMDPESLRLFEKEAGLLAGLRHDNIVTVFDADLWQGQRYLVMELIDGPDLARIVREEGPQPPERVVEWLGQAAAALAHAHSRGVIHRDIKAANFLLEQERGRLYMSDFGLAWAVEQSGGSSPGASMQVLTGTAAYRAPEVRKTGHTAASDLYSLGVVAYELLAGKRLFPGNDPLDLMMAHASDPVPALPDGTPDWLGKVVLRLLAKEADKRFADAPALQKALVPPAPKVIVAQSPNHPIAFDWVTIPAGAFTMGSTESHVKEVIEKAGKRSYTGTFKESWFTCELPQHSVYVPEFRMARVPVTVAQFAAFVKATGYRTTAEEKGDAWSYTGEKWEWVKGADWRHPRGPESSIQGKEHHPVTCVSWFDALAFCKWAGARLPTEAEWEKAARGTDGRVWPWDNQEPTKEHCNFDWNVKDTSPVGQYSKGASPYGLLDMAGNVWEWTITRWGGYDWDKPGFPYPYDPADGRDDLTANDSRVLRGGSFSGNASYVRCANRYWDDPDRRGNNVGFRVVLPPGF